MADQDPINPNNGSGPEGEPQIAIIAQYVKDLSVESPSSPAVFQWQAQPQVDVQFGINVNNVSDEVHEVILKVKVSARSDEGPHFLVELSYAGLIGIRNVAEDASGQFLLIEAPRMLFPFVRQIVADAVQHAGFPALMLEPIDFSAVYLQQLNAMQQAEGGDDAAPEVPADGSDQNNG